MELILYGSGTERAELEVLVKNAPLCVAGVWDWTWKKRIPSLYRIYLVRDQDGFSFGPHYAILSAAEQDVKKTLKAFPKGFWEQPLDWYGRQTQFLRWVEKNLGRSDYLVGGVWEK